MSRHVLFIMGAVAIAGFLFGQGKFVTTASGLKMRDLVVGQGLIAKNGSKVQVNYTGYFYQKGARGAKFDSSVDRQKPFVFTIGKGEVIKGWEEGIKGMKVKGKRELIIPPGLAYGTRGRPGIPPNATLDFEIELLAIAQ